MRPTKLLVAALILAGLSGLIWWAKKHPEDKSAATPAAPKLLNIPDAQVKSIDLTQKGSTLTLVRNQGKWEITAPQAYAADQDAVTSMISSLSGMTADSIVDAQPGNLATYGLVNPAVTVTVQETNGKSDHLFFGDDVPTSGLVYARVNSDPKVYAVASNLKSSFSKELADLRDKRLLTLNKDQVSRLQIVTPKSDIEFGKASQADWQILKPQPYRADTFQVDDLLSKLTDAKMDLSAKPEDVKSAESSFNTGHPVAKAELTDAGQTQTLDVRQNKDDYYARSSIVPGTFKFSADLGKLLAKPLDDFRTKKIFDFGFSDVTKFTVQQGSKQSTFVRSGTDWKSGSTTMDAGSVQSVIDKLRDLSASAFVPTGFANADDAITVISNDGKHTEHVEFSKAADGYIARREGQPALYKLDAKSVNDILEGANSIKPATAPAKK